MTPEKLSNERSFVLITEQGECTICANIRNAYDYTDTNRVHDTAVSVGYTLLDMSKPEDIQKLISIVSTHMRDDGTYLRHIRGITRQ
jgi:hypothetical protein